MLHAVPRRTPAETTHVLLLAAALVGCAADAPLVRPDVPVAARLPEGTALVAVLEPGLPDTVEHRALAVWWREALRLSERFALAERREGGEHPAADGRPLTLSADGDGRFVVRLGGEAEVVLCTGTRGSRALPALVDELAWATRLALGEQVDAPSPVAEITSADPHVVTAIDDAHTLLQQGGFAAAHRTASQARRRDGGAPFVLEVLAACELLRGNLGVAERLCQEALGYERRLAPTTAHRLARNLLLARASLRPEDAARHDDELATLAEVFLRERPHDAEGVLTQALAHNFRAEFEQAEPLLRALRTRFPERALVDYHLGWARLALGEPRPAAEDLAVAARRLPAPWVLLPRAIALFESGQHDALLELLRATEADYGRTGTLPHQILRMQAAHALLQNDRDTATQRVLEDLQWLADHPEVLQRAVGEFAEAGIVLVRLGGGAGLTPLLDRLQRQHHASAVADACSFLDALQQAHERGERLPVVESNLARAGDSAWSALLTAYGHELRGEVADMMREQSRAARLSGTPLTKALLARSLARTGQRPEAENLRTALRREMRTIHLRRPCQHPLFGPELAYAFVIE